MIAGERPESEIMPRMLSSRNAVETAIDSSKADQNATWEGSASKLRKTIQPWEVVARPEAGKEAAD